MMRRFNQRILILLCMSLLLSILVAGCGASPIRGGQGGSSGESARSPIAGAAPPVTDIGSDEARADFDATDPLAPPTSQAIIRNASLSLEVGTDIETKLAELQTIVTHYKGYVAESRLSGQEPGYRHASAVLRIPAVSFDQVLADLQQLGTVISRHTDTEDVGDQLIDLEARLGAANERETRLRELISRATSIEDLINLERELARVRTEIETIQAHLKRLRDLVALSTINVSLREVPPGQEPAGHLTVWQRTALAFERGVTNARELAASLLVFTVALLPVLAVLAAIFLPIFFGARAVRRSLRNRRQARAGAETGAGGPDRDSGSGQEN